MHSILPNFNRIGDLLAEHPEYFGKHWSYTFQVSAVACLAALLFASLLAGLCALSPKLRAIFSPLVVASQSFPLQSIGPVIIIAIGAGFQSHVLIAAVISFFPMYTIVLGGLLSPARPLVYFCRSLRASEWSVLWHVRIPSAMGVSINAIKVGFTLSVIGAVVGEFIAPTKGVGHVLLIAQSSFDVSTIYICVSLLIIQGLAIYGVLSILERKVSTHFV